MSFRVDGPDNNFDPRVPVRTGEGKPDSELSAKELVEKYQGQVPAEALRGWEGSLAELSQELNRYREEQQAQQSEKKNGFIEWLRRLSPMYRRKAELSEERDEAIRELENFSEKLDRVERNIAKVQQGYEAQLEQMRETAQRQMAAQKQMAKGKDISVESSEE